jgi:hypothetical protein
MNGRLAAIERRLEAIEQRHTAEDVDCDEFAARIRDIKAKFRALKELRTEESFRDLLSKVHAPKAPS